MLHQSSLWRRRQLPAHQRRSFMGLQRTPPPKPCMMGYLVLQGLAIVLLADYGFASLLGHPTVVQKVARSAGLWKDGPTFDQVHKREDTTTDDSG